MPLLTDLKAKVGGLLWRGRHKRAVASAYAAVAAFPAVRGVRHKLPGELILSLTSYPPRYATLPLTLKGLLDQKTKPNRTILWIAEGADWDALTPEILALRDHGLEICRCVDVRSYNKIIPTIELNPDAFIVTADDDIYYDPDWLAELVDAYLDDEPAICAWRAHRVTRDPAGNMAPYGDWAFYVVEPVGATASIKDLFPTGIGGVIYPPGCLGSEVTNRALFTEICPMADDVWLYWMGRRAGARYRQIGRVFHQIMWDGSQEVSLYSSNAFGGNDRQIAAMHAHFGPV